MRHTTPWNATTKTAYKGLSVEVTDPLLYVTEIQNDALGRPVTITDAKSGITSYTYGPFDTLYTVTAPGGGLTRTTRDAYGRVRTLEEPNRGTTTLVHDGFGQLRTSKDALGRTVTFEQDELGRTKSRTDQYGAAVETTTWTWDTAPHGTGRIHKITSPDGERTYSFNPKGQLESVALSMTGESEALKAGLTYHPSGHVATITYPSPNGAAPFVVAQDFDPHGFMLRARDSATGDDYWRLTSVDNAGRFRREVFGNDVSSERSYHDDKQALKSIATWKGASQIQKLGFEWDERLDLRARTDALQKQYTTERFRYDPVDRLTCAYFGVNEDPLAPCAQSFDYAPNGNLIFKSDIGVLTYSDPKHPHAVTSAGGGSYGYNAAGNQITRPGGMAITYTPFDLPRTITQGPDTITLGYDGEQKRIRKATPAEEILYFENLYERVTELGPGGAKSHRYYVHSPERAVAVVTRGGAKPGTKYLHVDHLGSVNAVTNENGGVDERRSHDAYGQRRNPEWGQPSPPSWNSKTTKGFTGHESDEELGLVNMKGRLFDPKLGRFITTDPVVANLYSGQSFNAYSYVHGNPLTFIDPSGFWEDAPGGRPEYDPDPDGHLHVCIGPKCDDDADDEEPDDEASSEEFGAAAPPTDVDTTGSSAGSNVQGSAPDTSWRENKYVQTEGGFIGGLGLGIVPYASMGRQALEDARVMAPGTRDFSVGRSVGEMVGGLLCLLGGLGGEVVGSGLSVTAVGAAVGVPAIVVSTGLVVGGAANTEAGFQGLLQAFKSPSSGGSGSSATPSPGGGSPRPSSSALGRNMERAGQTRPPGTAAHHLVAGNAKPAAASKAILQKFGIGINDAENGVFLPLKTHYHVHTNAYYRAVYNELVKATTTDEVIDVLASIRYALMNGGFP